MQIVPCLTFRGQTREAFDFYAAALGGEIELMQTFGESPMADQVMPDQRDLVMHASLRLKDGAQIFAADTPPAQYQPPQGIWISVHLESPEEAERIFAAFSDGGTVLMRLEKTFWARAFGMVTDRFGTPWMVNCA